MGQVGKKSIIFVAFFRSSFVLPGCSGEAFSYFFPFQPGLTYLSSSLLRAFLPLGDVLLH